MWDAEDTPVWGTASPALFWLAVEQPGPWGTKAFTQSRLDPSVGAALEQQVTAAGGRAVLMRSVSDRRESTAGVPVRVFLAGGAASNDPWLMTGLFVDPSVLLHLPWEKIAAGDRAAAQRALPELALQRMPVLLVCTNGKRDVCCAVRGRAVAAYAAGQRPSAVWECSHTGGHRFAPTGVSLPSGATFGRFDGPLATATWDASVNGQLPAAAIGGRHLRGLAHLTCAQQAADAFLRAHIGELDIAALQVTSTTDVSANDLTEVKLRHRDGRSWTVHVSATTAAGPPVSCGGTSVASTSYAVTLIG
ncbi:hypothetical protein KEM60_02338 [Austwickia sp. TVS 96-490-7B]|uniref:sucrase ferredoxin n=1 Tax=Austwickia sp. TVS 96-490-7B TaxID=2830843 RepID=UPI001C599692|nr:sucrase ferredoxin [Austwickia sp. TVS 96-490-7B]MBW3086127.1 hypothetical protein [Austwickia sp. TVS 96-490-7B]